MQLVRIKNLEIGSGKPVFIAGPCSIESLDHIKEEGQALKDLGVDILRGGAFKPRTNPKDFQGLGMEAARYLKEAGQASGLPVISEIMRENDIEEMSQYVDIFQVGTRNMYNYPLLSALGKARVPVLLKRGFNATLKEWEGAAEYIAREGNDDIIFCERGIRTFNEDMRNTLDLAGAVLIRSRTQRPVIVDPSHGTGRRDLIGPMSKAALAAGLDGLMIEVHKDPDEAISDSAQTIDYKTFKKIRDYFS